MLSGIQKQEEDVWFTYKKHEEKILIPDAQTNLKSKISG